MYVMSFSGNPKLEWLPDGRNMLLLEDFSFADTQRIWTAPKGCVINGASIPKVLWTLLGSPFIGQYRNASIIHDYYCGKKNVPWLEVHKMFYKAMIVGGVDKIKAGMMYKAVYDFGPRWDKFGNPIIKETGDSSYFELSPIF